MRAEAALSDPCQFDLLATLGALEVPWEATPVIDIQTWQAGRRCLCDLRIGLRELLVALRAVEDRRLREVHSDTHNKPLMLHDDQHHTVEQQPFTRGEHRRFDEDRCCKFGKSPLLG